MLTGRLGLETARLPHSDRHGLVALDRGNLTVEDGCLTWLKIPKCSELPPISVSTLQERLSFLFRFSGKLQTS